MRINYILLCVLVVLSTGCGNKKAEPFSALPFPDVYPPEMLQDPQDMAEYMAEHWWDRLTDVNKTYPSDSVLVNGVNKGEVEQKFADWANVLNMLRWPVVQKSVNHLFDRVVACEKKDTSSNVFETFNDLVIKYLYDPNSPLRNEDHYAIYAERLATCDLVEDVMQKKYSREVRLAALNRVGTKASDFRFMDKEGRIHTLHGIQSELTLLFFSNPGCTACKDIIDVLNNDPVISGLISSKTLTVLNIYIDENIEEWRSYMPIYPESWYNGFDPDMVIRGETVYNVRAIPSLYLLDKDKNVIMKDAPEARVFGYLSRLVQ